MTRLAVFGLLIMVSPPALAQPAADYYVSPTGNDSWSGSLASANRNRTDGPFATLSRAIAAVRELRKRRTLERPISVLMRAGRYELSEPLVLTSDDNGTTSAPLIIAAFPGETPILSGGTASKVSVKNGLWEIRVPDAKSAIRHIAVGGEIRLPNRWPKQGHFTMTGLAGADPKAHYRTPADRFEFADGQLNPKWPNLNDIEVVILHFWVDGHYRIKAIDADSRVVSLDRKSIRRLTEDQGAKPGRFYLLNVPIEISPGEFVYDRSVGVIRYRPMPGETPESTTVVVPRLETTIRFEGQLNAAKSVSHIELRGLTLSDSLFETGSRNAGDLQAAQHVTGSVQLRGATHCAIRDCRLVNLGGYGIELADGCRSNHVTGNELAHLAAGGIRLNGGPAGSPETRHTRDNRITDNHLHHLGIVFHAGVGILSQHAAGNRISHNHIHHLNYTGISVGWVWGYGPSISAGNIIEGNLIHDVGQKVLSDMGGIYMLGVSPGTIVRGNVIRDVESFGYGGWGIYTDEGSSGILIENNLVYRTKSGGFHQHYGRDNIVRNNIFALAREGQLMRSRAEAHISFRLEQNIVYAHDAPIYTKNWMDDKFVVNRNLFWDASGREPGFPGGTFREWQARGHDTDSLIADPLFVAPTRGDFRLRPGSPVEKIGFRPIDFSRVGVRTKGREETIKDR
jgi:parallel beta-helix repeat protein